jgi:hypothetical protein
MGKGGKQFRIRAGVSGRPIAPQGQDIIDPHGSDSIEEAVDFVTIGGHPGEMGHDLEPAGVDQLLADLQGIALGGTAGPIGHRGKQWPQLFQFPGNLDKTGPVLLLFRRKEFQGNKGTAFLHQLGNLHALLLVQYSSYRPEIFLFRPAVMKNR